MTRTPDMKRSHTAPSLPSKDDLVAFIGKQPGKIGTREIARAFGLKNADRATLKRMLRELADEGRVERRRKKLHHPGTLPHVVLADIAARDSDGELIALPTEWDEAEHGPAPKIRVHVPRRARPNEIAGVGDRALLRVEESGEKDDPIRHSGRVIKLIDRAKQRVLGIFRARPGRRRTALADRQEAARPGACDPARRRRRTRRTATWSRSRSSQRRSGFGLASARVKEKLGSLATERAVSLIAIHAHSIPHVFPAAATAEAEAARPARTRRPRGLARAAADHHRSGRRQGPRRRRARGAPIPIRAIPAAS